MGVLDTWFSFDGIKAVRRGRPDRPFFSTKLRLYRTGFTGTAEVDDGSQPLAYEWSDTNLPWDYTTTSDFESRLPSGVPVVNIQTGSSDFYTNLNNTVNAQSGRFICRLPAGVFATNSFRMIGSSGDPSYSFGFWFPKLAGFVGAGADKTFIQMNANSMSQAQLDYLSTNDRMLTSAFAPLQMGVCRIDASETQPAYLGGLTYRSDDQQMLTATRATDMVVPQPAPHQGVTLYSNGAGVFTVSHVRFQACGRAATSQPPFEMANVTSQGARINWYNTEFDSRLSSDFDVDRPRRCGPWMGNNEVESNMYDCWIHHSNVSRYAANDENRDTAALSTIYTLTRCKIEQITNTQNVDPKLNGGASLGGYTNATPLGWESTNAELRITNCIIEQNNSNTSRQIAQHLQLTSVGGRNPQGGRMYVNGGIFRNVFSSVNNYLCMRVTNTFWSSDGYANTIDVRNSQGVRKTAYVFTGTWPPTAAQLSAAGVTPETHYIVRTS